MATEVIIKHSWMNSSHYHCKCGAEIRFLRRVRWNENTGAQAIGICNNCDMMMVEREHGRLRWVSALRRKLRLV